MLVNLAPDQAGTFDDSSALTGIENALLHLLRIRPVRVRGGYPLPRTPVSSKPHTQESDGALVIANFNRPGNATRRKALLQHAYPMKCETGITGSPFGHSAVTDAIAHAGIAPPGGFRRLAVTANPAFITASEQSRRARFTLVES